MLRSSPYNVEYEVLSKFDSVAFEARVDACAAGERVYVGDGGVDVERN